jgi:hypothetical protein
VDNLETRLWGPTKELQSEKDGDGDTVLQSPFANSDFSRIQDLLQQMVNTTRSPLDTKWFLVLDGESEQTSTAVIVRVDEDGDVRSVHVAYPVASRYLAAASIGHPPLEELIESVEGEGGVICD